MLQSPGVCLASPITYVLPQTASIIRRTSAGADCCSSSRVGSSFAPAASPAASQAASPAAAPAASQAAAPAASQAARSDEHTSELQSLMRNSYAVFCLNKK